MNIVGILLVSFTLLLMAPILSAALHYKRKKSAILYINQNKTRDARFFGKSFSSMVKEHLDSAADGKILLSRKEPEPYMDADASGEDDYEETVQNMVIARRKKFCPPQTVRLFEKEIYCGEDALLRYPETELRAIYCEKKAVIGNGVSVVRWADAGDTLAVYDNCNLGISVSAAQALSVGHGCTFRRMYAPMIRIGQYPDSTLSPEAGKDPRIYHLRVQINKENNIRYINNDRVNDEGIVDFSVISPHKITVTDGLIVQGDVRSHRGIRLCDNAVVCGNIFAEGDIWLGINAAVLGNVFTQGSIHFEKRATVGQRGKISSVIARENITFEGDNFVFGYVSCEMTGKTEELPKEENENGENAEPPVYLTLATPEGLRHLRFENLTEFENVDWQGYRREKELEDVVIPDGAKGIQRSMFFDCEILRRADLPDTLRTVEDYAFADCFSLQGVGDFHRMPLEKIGTSAFENCREISAVDLPAGLLSLGGAAFAGCTALKSVRIPEDSVLRTVGAHCFRGCAISEIWFPDTTAEVGVSAFRDCSALRRVSVPETCAQQPGIAELAEWGVEVELRPLPEPEQEEAEHG